MPVKRAGDIIYSYFSFFSGSWPLKREKGYLYLIAASV